MEDKALKLPAETSSETHHSTRKSALAGGFNQPAPPSGPMDNNIYRLSGL
jgi:hypothetical protein